MTQENILKKYILDASKVMPDLENIQTLVRQELQSSMFCNDREYLRAIELFTHIFKLCQYGCRLALDYANQRTVKSVPIINLSTIKSKIKTAQNAVILMQNHLLQILLLCDSEVKVTNIKSVQLQHAIEAHQWFIEREVIILLDELLYIFGASGYMSDNAISILWKKTRDSINQLRKPLLNSSHIKKLESIG